MKKIFLILLFLNFSFGLESLKVGASPTPHALILKHIEKDLEKEGFKLEIYEFTDGVQPNMSTDNNSLDANFFQHEPYLLEFNKNKGTKLVSVAKIHIEPMGVYSTKFKEFVPNHKAVISIPNNPTNEARALQILESSGLIKLKNHELATTLDIVENRLNIKFVEIKDAQLVRSLSDVDFSVINGNFALQAGLIPTKDALYLESKFSPYANILVVKEGNENSTKTKALIKALQSQKVKNFMNENFQGALIPAF
ncbi:MULTISPECIES: MetQ/NlpA family ABC transporter substrate-binding protein [unclassified Campylobacter]|uniref:MetQ/NlpA family ABC transporter substrate-binding protein n=1 Tax=unclassified Campylobacter TaxID=2593542 RepID=UPI001237D57C|nr:MULTISPECIES: MetQ/NlpA family ABC transporter substrate-binding protein [unclassified Campylobacter]KAA6225327.1 ABC transporter substrate-binding protein [Campylobacter sp. LR286c]KAA6225554.1 ABC transporter substrate-binding protein [Campylobacter sp. LR185c]KAA6230451.1 ABC transporter substrate-binding protein [Campylobacter sp. LR291e]KAA8604856.1 ABC transporter substrate-binding protein [Campylobacter sp. LR185c]